MFLNCALYIVLGGTMGVFIFNTRKLGFKKVKGSKHVKRRQKKLGLLFPIFEPNTKSFKVRISAKLCVKQFWPQLGCLKRRIMFVSLKQPNKKIKNFKKKKH